MIVGCVKETFPGERRAALVPAVVPLLKKSGADVLVESGAGLPAGFTDGEYEAKGARLSADRAQVFAAADVVVQVRSFGANPDRGAADLELLRRGQVLIGLAEPLTSLDAVRKIAATGATLFALELVPRTTRAQSMDVLSSMAMLAGYRATLLAATHLPKMFPMMITAAGTLAPSKVLVIGAGVAGLQAIATAKRLGAVVSAHDVRPAVKQEVESLGARFVELEVETQAAQDKTGYAKAMGEEFYRRQRELMAKVVSEQDVVITTAAVPGRRAPVLVTAEMVRGMRPGSFVIDIAAERGGNCELTRPGETVVVQGVSVMGPVNLPSEIPNHASQLFAKNVTAFVQYLTKDGAIRIDPSDEIARGTLVIRDGEVQHPQVVEALGQATAAAGA